MADTRQTVTMRYRRGTLRAIREVAALMDGTSRENVVHMLLLDGLAVAYDRLGVEGDPAVMAGRLLEAVGETWADDLTAEELAAFTTARGALNRIAELRAKDTGP